MEEVLDGVTIHRLSKRIASVEQPGLRHIILDFSGVNSKDAAVATDTLEEFIEDIGSWGSSVHIAGMKGPVRDVARKVGWPRSSVPRSTTSR
jgi:anti-anti-sigma regulatory factor